MRQVKDALASGLSSLQTRMLHSLSWESRLESWAGRRLPGMVTAFLLRQGRLLTHILVKGRMVVESPTGVCAPVLFCDKVYFRSWHA